MDNLFSNAFERLLEDQCPLQRVRQIEAGGSPATLWSAIEESGFLDALVDEAKGGAGLNLTEAYSLLELCGRHAVPVALAETMVARAILSAANVEFSQGGIGLATAANNTDGSIGCDVVGSGRELSWVFMQTGAENLLLPVISATCTPGSNSLGARLQWPAAAVLEGIRVPGEFDLMTLQGCVFAAQLAGGLMTVFERTLQFANERVQFGRPIGKFQAIQHQLAIISEHAFAARMAAQIGCNSTTAIPQKLRVAVAKARASEAALEVATMAHSIHGAIGFTEEFDLQIFTRRLHSWRQAGGSESYWHEVLGAELTTEAAGCSLDVIRQLTDCPN